MISMLQNFIVTKQERLDTLRETLPDVAKFFDIDFHVNYNSKTNFKEVLSLYKDNINNYNNNLYHVCFNYPHASFTKYLSGRKSDVGL